MRHTIVKPRYTNMENQYKISGLLPARPLTQRLWDPGQSDVLISQGYHQEYTISATNISSNIVWFLQLHDTIQMKSNYTWINYNHDNIAIRIHIMIYNFVWNFIFDTKFSSIYLEKGERRLVFRLSFVNLQRAKDGTHVSDAKYRYVFVV